MVLVTIEDVNDNRPAFDQTSYSVTLLENSADNAVVFKATVTDRDQVHFIINFAINCDSRGEGISYILHLPLSQGGFVGTLRILPESTPFTIDSGGTVRVKNSAALDREITEVITFQVVDFRLMLEQKV